MWPALETYPPATSDSEKYFFTQCTIHLWNSLTQDVVMAISPDGFGRGTIS